MASMSMRALIGMVKELETPGMDNASFISFFIFSTSIPLRHSASGFRLITVSNISRGAGSVAVSARPAFPKTWATSGIFMRILSCICNNLETSEMDAPGMVTGM